MAVDQSKSIAKKICQTKIDLASQNRKYFYVDESGKPVEVQTDAYGFPKEYPSWTTIRKNHWKGIAKEPNAQKYEDICKGNIKRMKEGLAPIGSDGFSMVFTIQLDGREIIYISWKSLLEQSILRFIMKMATITTTGNGILCHVYAISEENEKC